VYRWRQARIKVRYDHFGAHHYYTQCFDKHAKLVGEKNVLAAEGILITAREAISHGISFQ
jgi:hypothetical protein